MLLGAFRVGTASSHLRCCSPTAARTRRRWPRGRAMCGGYDKASLVLYVPRRAFGPGDQIIAAGGGLGSHSSVCGTWAQRPPRRPGWAAAGGAVGGGGGSLAGVGGAWARGPRRGRGGAAGGGGGVDSGGGGGGFSWVTSWVG